MTMRVLAVLVVSLAAIQAAPAAVDARAPTLTVRPSPVAYGKGITLTGVVPSKRAGETVTVMSQACGFTASAPIATVRTRRGGVFRYAVEPLINTTFSVRWKAKTSARRAVRVTPGIALEKLAPGRYRAEVYTTNGQFLDGREVLLQRAEAGGWATVAAARLERASSEFELTLTSAVMFDVAVPAGSQLRVELPQSEATCYSAATSASVAA